MNLLFPLVVAVICGNSLIYSSIVIYTRSLFCIVIVPGVASVVWSGFLVASFLSSRFHLPFGFV